MQKTCYEAGHKLKFGIILVVMKLFNGNTYTIDVFLKFSLFFPWKKNKERLNNYEKSNFFNILLRI